MSRTARSSASTQRERSDNALRLKKPLERSLRAGHPWIFRDALEAHSAAPGSEVRVLDRKGKFLARGWAESGPIGVRVFSLEDRALDAKFMVERVRTALSLRAKICPPETDAYRLLHGEGDRLPGIVCDRYGSCAVLKLDGDAASEHAERIARLLQPELTKLGIESLLVRVGRKSEQSIGLAWGPAPPEELRVHERGMKLLVNLYSGQKTGLFLDHRETRARVRALACGMRVLNLYGYTGGFSVAAGLGGAEHVVTVDVARPALELAERTWTDNGLPTGRHETRALDALEYLTGAAERGERYTLVVADPPNFAPRQSAVSRALGAYVALHEACLRVLEPGGFYLAASCSSHVDRAAFEDSVREGAHAARRILQVLEQSGAPADHPRLSAFPEGDYLKVLLSRG